MIGGSDAVGDHAVGLYGGLGVVGDGDAGGVGDGVDVEILDTGADGGAEADREDKGRVFIA